MGEAHEARRTQKLVDRSRTHRCGVLSLAALLVLVWVSTTATTRVAPQDDEYELKVDDQVAGFLQTKQRLSYFLITAATAVIGFAVSFIAANAKTASGITLTHLEAYLAGGGSVLGLAAAGATLFSLKLGHQSFSLHLKNRYAHKRFSDLPTNEQEEWDRIIDWASRLQTTAGSQDNSLIVRRSPSPRHATRCDGSSTP
jgi:hypothetical protein